MLVDGASEVLGVGTRGEQARRDAGLLGHELDDREEHLGPPLRALGRGARRRAGTDELLHGLGVGAVDQLDQLVGAQTGVYPQATPGGWQIIGRTPLTLFDPARAPPCLLAPDDRVRFVAIEPAAFNLEAGGP